MDKTRPSSGMTDAERIERAVAALRGDPITPSLNAREALKILTAPPEPVTHEWAGVVWEVVGERKPAVGEAYWYLEEVHIVRGPTRLHTVIKPVAIVGE